MPNTFINAITVFKKNQITGQILGWNPFNVMFLLMNVLPSDIF